MKALQVRVNVDQLAAEIRDHEERVRQSAGLALQHKIAVGKCLIQAKKQLGHGKFLEWAQAEFGWTRQHVARHILLARNGTRVSHLSQGASLRAALAAIRGEEQKQLQAATLAPQFHMVIDVDVAKVDSEERFREFVATVARAAEDLGARVRCTNRG